MAEVKALARAVGGLIFAPLYFALGCDLLGLWTARESRLVMRLLFVHRENRCEKSGHPLHAWDSWFERLSLASDPFGRWHSACLAAKETKPDPAKLQKAAPQALH